MNGETMGCPTSRQTLKRKPMNVFHPLNDTMEVNGVTYKETNGSIEVPKEIGKMLIETFGFTEVKEVKKSKKNKED